MSWERNNERASAGMRAALAPATVERAMAKVFILAIDRQMILHCEIENVVRTKRDRTSHEKNVDNPIKKERGKNAVECVPPGEMSQKRVNAWRVQPKTQQEQRSERRN